MGLIILTGIALSGCDDETPASTVSNTVNINGNDVSDDTSISNNAKSTSITGIDKEHALNINGDNIKFICTYKIDANRINDYLFTIPSFNELGIRLKEDNERYNIKVSGVYSEVYVSSYKARFNGLRQDSMHLDFSSSPTGGFDISSTVPYEQLFLVEGVNQNQQFMVLWHGTGTTSYISLTESEIREYSDGAVLRTVWNVTIDDTLYNKRYSNYMVDEVFMGNR